VTPLILIPGRLVKAGVAGRHQTVAVGVRYLEALRRAGAEGIVVQPRAIDHDEAHRILSSADGLLVIGGPDVDPALYGQEPEPETYGVNRVEDDFEVTLLRSAIEEELPTLAICRGMQVLNVALGGSLHQHAAGGPIDHIGTGFPNRRPNEIGPVIPVELATHSRVAEAMGSTSSNGTHLHHQTVDRLGEGLTVTGRTEDETIEAVEHKRGWVVGVQWHPEDTAVEDEEQQRLFSAFVAECLGRMGRT
jgi:putative glutamine amidotransferase